MTKGKAYVQIKAILNEVDPNERLLLIEKLGKEYRQENGIRITNESKDVFRNLGLTKKNIDIGKPPVKRR